MITLGFWVTWTSYAWTIIIWYNLSIVTFCSFIFISNICRTLEIYLINACSINQKDLLIRTDIRTTTWIIILGLFKVWTKNARATFWFYLSLVTWINRSILNSWTLNLGWREEYCIDQYSLIWKFHKDI